MRTRNQLERELRAWMRTRPVDASHRPLLDAIAARTRDLPQERGWPTRFRSGAVARAITWRDRAMMPAAGLIVLGTALALGAGGLLFAGGQGPGPSPAPSASAAPSPAPADPARYLPAAIPDGVEHGVVETVLGPARWAHLSGDPQTLPGPLTPFSAPDGLLWFDGGGRGPVTCDPPGARPSRTYAESVGSEWCLPRPQLWASRDAIAERTERVLPVLAEYAMLSRHEGTYWLVTRRPATIWRSVDVLEWDAVDLSGVVSPGPAELDWEMDLGLPAGSRGVTVLPVTWRATDAGRLLGRPELGEHVYPRPTGTPGSYTIVEATEGGDRDAGTVRVEETEGGLRFLDPTGALIAELAGVGIELVDDWASAGGLAAHRVLVIDGPVPVLAPMPSDSLAAPWGLRDAALLGSDEGFRFIALAEDGTIRAWESVDGRSWEEGPSIGGDDGEPTAPGSLYTDVDGAFEPTARGWRNGESSWRTRDGRTWEVQELWQPMGVEPRRIAGGYVARSGPLLVSVDGVDWKAITVITKTETSGGGGQGDIVLDDTLFFFVDEWDGPRQRDLWVLEFEAAPR